MLLLSHDAARRLSVILQQHSPAQRARLEKLLECLHANRVERAIEALYPAPPHEHEHMLLQLQQHEGIDTLPDGTRNSNAGLGWFRWWWWSAVGTLILFWKVAVAACVLSWAAAMLQHSHPWQPQPPPPPPALLLSSPPARQHDDDLPDTPNAPVRPRFVALLKVPVALSALHAPSRDRLGLSRPLRWAERSPGRKADSLHPLPTRHPHRPPPARASPPLVTGKRKRDDDDDDENEDDDDAGSDEEKK